MEEDEDEPGTYSGDYMIAEGAHDGTYDITVKIQGTEVSVPATGALTIDTMPPTISASVDKPDVKNDDVVVITAEVGEDATSVTVTADVAMLDTTQTEPVTFTDGGEGTHTYSLTINSEADDGPQEIIVTATDAAENATPADPVMVTLDNTAPVITEPSPQQMHAGNDGGDNGASEQLIDSSVMICSATLRHGDGGYDVHQ